MPAKPKAAIIGGSGDYSSKLLLPISRYFNICALIDQPHGQARAQLPRWAQPLFVGSDGLEASLAACRGADVVFLLTPNHTHADLAVPLLQRAQAVVIEKPLVTTRGDLERIQQLVDVGAPIYCSDFYVDVRAAALLVAVGKLESGSWLGRKVVGRRMLPAILQPLDTVTSIDSHLHERYPVRRGTWLADRASGGVTFDMLPHSLALLRRLLPDQDLILDQVTRRYRASESPPGIYSDQPASPTEAEAWVTVEGHLSTSVPVRLSASKEAPANDRVFEITTPSARLVQHFGPGEELDVYTDQARAVLRLDGDRYWLMPRAVRTWLESGAKPYGWEWTRWTVEKLVEIREWPPGSPGIAATDRTGKERINQGRRALLQSAKVAAAMGAIGYAAGYFRKALSFVADAADGVGLIGVVTDQTKRDGDRAARRLSEERRVALMPLVGSPRVVEFSTGREHPDRPFAAGDFPHDRLAVAPFQFLAPGRLGLSRRFALRSDLGPGDLLVTTGSPTSSRLANRLMQSSQRIRNLPYSYQEIKDQKIVRVYSGMLEGKETLKGRKQLLATDGSVLTDDVDHIDGAGWLKRDYLLVSRLPTAAGHDVLLLSGGHGAGTQAAELLFDPDALPVDDLALFLSACAAQPYWQAVFEVSDIENRKPMTVANSIRLLRPESGLGPVGFSPVFEEVQLA